MCLSVPICLYRFISKSSPCPGHSWWLQTQNDKLSSYTVGGGGGAFCNHCLHCADTNELRLRISILSSTYMTTTESVNRPLTSSLLFIQLLLRKKKLHKRKREMKRGMGFSSFCCTPPFSRQRGGGEKEEGEEEKNIIYLCIIKKGRHFNQSAMKSVFPFLSVAGVEMERR